MSCLVGCVGKGIKYVFKCLIEITCPSWVSTNMGVIQGINATESGSIVDEFPEVFQGLGCLPGNIT